MPSYLSGGSESLNVGSDNLNVGSCRGSYTLQIGAHTSGVSFTINNRMDKNILMISECLNQVIAKTILYSTRCGTVDELLGLSLHYTQGIRAVCPVCSGNLVVRDVGSGS